MTCKEAAELISADLDRALLWHERLRLGLHLLVVGCIPCDRFRRQAAFLREAARQFARRIRGSSESLRLSAEARGRMIRALRSREL
jgi:hypothetical protein